MAKDINMCSDVISDVGGNTGGDMCADYGGDLASDAGVNLNAGDVSKAEGLAKATMMSCEAPPPPDYTTDALRPPDSAIYTEAPEHAGKTPEQVAAEMEEAWGYAGPANESEGTESPPKPEYDDSPPDDN